MRSVCFTIMLFSFASCSVKQDELATQDNMTMMKEHLLSNELDFFSSTYSSEDCEYLVVKLQWAPLLDHYLLTIKDRDSIFDLTVSRIDTLYNAGFHSHLDPVEGLTIVNKYRYEERRSKIDPIIHAIEKIESRDSTIYDTYLDGTRIIVVDKGEIKLRNVSDMQELDSLIEAIILSEIKARLIPWKEKVK